jgi:hypothetical protein
MTSYCIIDTGPGTSFVSCAPSSHHITQKDPDACCDENRIICSSQRDTPTMTMSDDNKLQAGICVQFQGLKSAPDLNGTYGTLIKYNKKEGRWAVRKDDDDDDDDDSESSSSSKTIAVKPENLGIVKEDVSANTTTPGLDPLEDKWNLTDTSNISDHTMKTCRNISAAAQTIADAEHKIYVHVNGGNKALEGTLFPTLFPFGSGMYGQDRGVNVRFEAYLRHLLRQYTGQFLKHNGWIQFVTKRAAMLRAITKRPAAWKVQTPEILDPRDIAALQTLAKIDATKAFCFRFLVGDKEAATLAIMFMHDNLNSR